MQERLIQPAYNLLLDLVAQGRITERDPLDVLGPTHDEWRDATLATELAAQLLDYAYHQATAASSAGNGDRAGAHRLRLYAVAQQLYDRLRLASTVGPATAAPQLA